MWTIHCCGWKVNGRCALKTLSTLVRLGKGAAPLRFSTFVHGDLPLDWHEEFTSTVVFPELAGIELNLITPSDKLYYASERELPDLFNHSLPWWGFLWPGGHSLTQFILDEKVSRKFIRGKQVLDFGSGCGVSAIAALKFGGARSVQVCDIDHLSLHAAHINAVQNGVVEEGAGPDSMMTFTDSNVIGSSIENIDVLIAGDVLYDDTLADELFPWFQYLSNELGKTVIFGVPDRWVLKRMGSEERMKKFKRLATFEFPEHYRETNHGITEGNVYIVQ